MLARRIHILLGRLARDTRGAALVEFAVTLPLYLIIFGLIVEGGRVIWNHQIIVKGVRDATRYMTRVSMDAIDNGTAENAAKNLAVYSQPGTGTARIAGWNPDQVAIDVAPPNAAGIRVVTVTASVPVTLSFAPLLNLMGGSVPGTVTYTVADQARYHGD